MIFSEWIISRTGGQSMVLIFYTTLTSVNLAQYELFPLKFSMSDQSGIKISKGLGMFGDGRICLKIEVFVFWTFSGI